MMTKRLLRIGAADGETALGLWEMPPVGRAILPPVLLVHGATFGSALFDLPLAGYSLMQELAGGGRFVYAIDISGYGASNGHGVMTSPPAAHPPFSRARQAVEDVGAAVSAIRRRHYVQAIDLIGFSWGTIPLAGTPAGMSAASAGWRSMRRCLPRRTRCGWTGSAIPPTAAARRTFWRLSPDHHGRRARALGQRCARQGARCSRGGRAGIRCSMRPPALTPLPASHRPPAFRCPNGAFADLIEVFNGRPLYDPGRRSRRRSCWCGRTRHHLDGDRLRRLQAAIGSAEKSCLEIPGGSHFLCIEKNHMNLYRAITGFLAMDGGNGGQDSGEAQVRQAER